MKNIKYKVVSDSMHPLIKINDELQVTSNKGDLRPFDIILFKRENRLIVHFIWRNQIKYNQTVITRSLKAEYNDEAPVHLSEIIGRIENYKFSFFQKIKFISRNLIFRKS